MVRGGAGKAPAGSVDAAGDEVPGTQAAAGSEGAGLGHVADRAGGEAKGASGRVDEAEQRAEERGLTGAVRTQDTDEGPGWDLQSEVIEDSAAAEANGEAVEGDGVHAASNADCRVLRLAMSQVW